MGKQYEKLGLLFVGYSCTLDKLSHLQNKMAFVKVEQALIPHFSKFQRQPAALYAEIIRKLLAGERNVEFIAAPALRLGGKIGHSVCAMPSSHASAIGASRSRFTTRTTCLT